VDLVHQPLHTILEGTGHRSPDLGGSTASMLAALIGLSLIRMAVEVSLGNDEGSEGGATDALEQALATLDQQSVALADLADADQDAFQAYLAALKRRHQPPPGAATRRRAPAAIFGGAALLHGALTGVLLAVDINLKSGQPQSRAALAADRDDLSWRGKAAFAEIKTRAEAAGYPL